MRNIPSSILVATSALGVAFLMANCKSKTSDAERTTATLPIEVAQVETDSLLLYRSYPGTLISTSTVDVVARANGTITGCFFDGGDMVKKGQLLFTIEDQSYKDAVEEARAQLATAKSTHDYAVKQYAAMSKAYESDAVSQMELLSAKNQMEQSEASIRQAEARLQTAMTNLSYCRVTAPISGEISSRSYDPGAYVGGEGAPVKMATIYDNAQVEAVFYIEDASYLRMFSTMAAREGINYAEIPVSFSETLPHDYTAKLYYLDPQVDKSTGTLKVQASIQNPYNELRSGMYVTIKLPWKADPKAILVKDAALSTDQLGKYLYVVNDSNKVVYTPVEAGDLYQDSLRVIISGLKPDDRYVTKAMLKVRNGMTVDPIMTK